MSQETTIAYTEVSFKDFLFKNKRNRTILWIAAVAIVLQWAVFKYFYPFASYIHGDSFSYLKAADENLSINTYMIGYSKFLRFISIISTSDFILTAFQYLLIQASTLFFLYSLFFFYNTAVYIQFILFSYMIFNPLFWHLGNLISSDGIFLAVSFIWIALLIWVINHSTTIVLLGLLLTLFVAFTLRYNALIYPFITALALILSGMSFYRKLKFICLCFIICGSFVLHTSYEYKKLTGYWQYSPFSGWQLANNAMYTYRYVNKEERKTIPEKYWRLDKMIREYFDSTRNISKFPEEAIKASTMYMWTKSSPLYVYRNSLFKKDTTATELKKWASMGPLFKAYGLYIISQYPSHYFKNFLWPNFKKYYAPPVEFLSVYNSGRENVTSIAQKWFKYKDKRLKTRLKNQNVLILDFYPIQSGIINVVFFCTIICLLSLKKYLTNVSFNKCIILAVSIWILNAGFTITASSAALRFQAFPILFCTTFALLLLDLMRQIMLKSTQDLIRTPIPETESANTTMSFEFK